jgi:hypothetical protein
MASQPFPYPPGCGGAASDFVARALQRHRKGRGERFLVAGIRPELVVPNGIGEPFQLCTWDSSQAFRSDGRALAGRLSRGI